MMAINKKLAVFIIIAVLLIGISLGLLRATSVYQPKIQANRRFIDERVEKVVDEMESKKKADIQLYVLSADDVDAGERVHFYFRSDDNPFWRAHEIMEIEGINFENMVIRESDLLEEEK